MHILIADDHQLFLDGMRHILGKLGADVTIEEANSAEQAIALLESGTDFDLVLIDLCMPGMDGMSILQRMREREVWWPLVIISAENDPRTIKCALDAGAMGFIPKAHGTQHMLAALHLILEGEIYVPDDIQKQIDNLPSRRLSPELDSDGPLDSTGITRRQFDVLQLLAKGYSNKQIATTLCLTEHTVKAHVSALFNTLNANNRTDCVRLAERRGILG